MKKEIEELSERLDKLENMILAASDISQTIQHSITYCAENCLETGYLLTVCEFLTENLDKMLDEIDLITQKTTVMKIEYKSN